jgi:hypothetical protein
MKSGSPCAARLGIAFLCLLLASNAFGAGNSRPEKELSDNATRELVTGVKNAGGIPGNPRLEVKAVIESEARNAAGYYCGTAFYVFLDGLGDPRLVYGSFGLGRTAEEARQGAFKEWQMMFLSTFLHALSRSAEDYIEKDGLRIFYSTLMVRGSDPFTRKDAREELAWKLVAPYLPTVEKTILQGAKQLPDIQTVLISMAVDKGGTTGGQWQFNGGIVPDLLASAKECGLPLQGHYMVKQYFIFQGTKFK